MKFKKKEKGSDQCGWLGWPLVHKARGHWFNSPSGHKPGFQAWSRSGKRQLIKVSLFVIKVSLPLVLPPFPSK